MASKCRSCGAEIIFLQTSKGRQIPVDMTQPLIDDTKAAGRTLPLIFDPKRHTSHFATCPNANDHRTKR